MSENKMLVEALAACPTVSWISGERIKKAIEAASDQIKNDARSGKVTRLDTVAAMMYHDTDMWMQAMGADKILFGKIVERAYYKLQELQKMKGHGLTILRVIQNDTPF